MASWYVGRTSYKYDGSVAIPEILKKALFSLVLLSSVTAFGDAFAHGGVVEEDDLCVIKINYLKGHFKIYQPLTDGHRDYCEDLPNATESVFVMEFLHDGLASVPLEFRIIRDVTGKGRFARWDDVRAIGDLDAVTEYYRAPAVEPDVLTVVHDFAAEGNYIGIVTANADEPDRVYRAVFPFEVGYTGLGYWPWIVAAVLLVQLQYLLMSGRLRRWWVSRNAAHSVCIALALVMSSSAARAEPETFLSERGLYAVQFSSELEPLPVNRIHACELSVRAMNGDAVTGAEIMVDGGMPAHDHGLPTRPRVTAELGDGRYRVDGLRFHMRGAWEIVVAINAAGGRDTVTIRLEL